MIDVERHLGAVERSVSSLERDGRPARAVTLARGYDTTIEDLWDALTNKERLPRWFAPVEGEFKPGGRYQIEGNAGGEISKCEQPSYLALTWEFAGDVSWVEVRLSAEASGKSRLTLTHTAHVSDHWKQYGPGATGVGWELGLLGIALYLASPDAEKFDETAFAASPEGKAMMRGSADAWAEADIKNGDDPAQARAAAKATGDFYTGETQAGA